MTLSLLGSENYMTLSLLGSEKDVTLSLLSPENDMTFSLLSPEDYMILVSRGETFPNFVGAKKNPALKIV